MAGDDGYILGTRLCHDGGEVLLDRQLQTLILSRSGRVRILSDVLTRDCVLDYTKRSHLHLSFAIRLCVPYGFIYSFSQILCSS